MRHVYRVFGFLFLMTGCAVSPLFAQQIPLGDTTVLPFDSTQSSLADTSGDVTSVDATLMNIYNQRQPKKYKIRNITVSGNHYFDQALLVSISTLTTGEEVVIPGGDNFAKAIQKLWSQNYFSDVEIYLTQLEGDQIDVEIAVTERPRLADFRFDGSKKAEEDDLKTKTGLVKGRVITENMKRTASDAIVKYYAEKGFRGVTVDIRAKQDSALVNSQILTFVVNRGKKIKISDIFIVNNTVDDAKIKRQMKGTKEMGRLTLYPPTDTSLTFIPKAYTFSDYMHDKGFFYPSKTGRVLNPYLRLKFFNAAKFNDKKYNEDRDKIVDYYNSLGYRDAVITSGANAITYNSKGNMDITIKVSEGSKYYFGNISWSGNLKYPDSLLTAVLAIKKGDIYNLDLLNKKLGKNLSPEGGDVSSLYMDDGYLFFRTEVTETAVYNDTIDFNIKLIEGPQATWKNVRITGNEKTKEYVIRRELRTLPGEKFSRQDVIRSTREIANLGFFNQEKINPNIVPNQEDGTVDVTWEVEEKSSDQLELSAGFGGGIGLTGTLGVSFNNFSINNIFHKEAWDPLPVGDGQKLSIRFQSNGRAYRSYNVSFTEPWLGGKKRNSLTVSLYDTKYSNGYSYSPYGTPIYDKNSDTIYFRTTGIAIGLGKQLKWPDDYFSFTTTLSYNRYKLSNYTIDRSLQLRDGSYFNNGISNNVNLRLALQRSSISQPIFPTSGSNFLLSLQLTPPWSAINPSILTDNNPYKLIEYHKWRFTGEWYVPLGKPRGEDKNQQFVLKASAKYGFLGRYNNQLQISPFERFQVGDAGLSNSFALLGYDIISQRGYPVYSTSDPKVNPDQQQTTNYFTIFNKYTLELRYPLSLNPSSTIYGLGFFEAANGWDNFKQYNPFQLRRSVGLGMRFYLPMFGLLGFDYGIGLDRYTPGATLKDIGRFTFMLGYEPD